MGKRAVVLGGGGAKGAYEVGVMKALKELKFDYQIVTGTSVGSLNGALFAQKNYKLAEKMWLSINTAKVLDMEGCGTEQIGYAELAAMLTENRGLDYHNLKTLLLEVIDEEKIRKSGVDFGLITVRYPLMQPVQLFVDQMEKGKLVEYLLASAACFPAMKKHEIDGQHYIDGGYYDNLPINLAIERGADEIVAVDLGAVGVTRKKKDSSATRVITIKSEWPLGPMLLFEQDQIRLNIQQGYVDTMKVFGKWEGSKFCFRTGETEKLFKAVYPAMEQLQSLVFPDAGNPLMQMAQVSAAKLYQRRMHSKQRLSQKECCDAVCEGLMEIFELDRFRRYTLRSLKKECIRIYEQVDETAAYALEELLREIRQTKKFMENIEQVTAIVAGIDRKVVVKYLIGMLNRMRANQEESGILYLLYLCIPLEVTSAMYYLSLT